MDFSDRHVVVTGGTGALGTAVAGALVKAGAICHVPYVEAAEAERFTLRGHAQVKLLPVSDLADEASVARLFGDVSPLWASIHIAGGFAMKPVAETTRSDLMQQIDMNFVTAFLCCRAAVNAMARSARAGASSMSRRAQRSNGAPAPAWPPIPPARPRSPRSPWRWRRKSRSTASWSTRSRRRSWTRPPIAPPCRKPITRYGRRSRRSRRPSCSWRRPTTR